MKKTLLELRVGTRERPPGSVTLQAGELTVDFVAGGLRALRFAGHEVLRAIAYVVRDPSWGTYNPEISDCSIQQGDGSFTVTYRARCVSSQPNQALSYQAAITGNAQGNLLFEVLAQPLTPFLTARCGFAVLHPIDGVAGQPVIVEHANGPREQAVFPQHIAPAQPFKDIRAMQHWVTPGITARCSLNGDVFEMEDQRNWSDASFKTYVRPLSLPWPYVMEQAVPNRQSVELEIKRNEESSAALVRGKAGARKRPVRVTVGAPQGVFPGIGVSLHPDEIAEALDHPSLLTDLHPQLLLFHFDPGAGHGIAELRGFAQIVELAPSTGQTESILELVLPAQRDVREELSGIAAMVAEAGLPLSGILVSPAVDRKSTLPGGQWPPCPPLEEIYQAARLAFPGAAIGGGTLSYFTELNRKRPPVDLLDFVSHCTCPIVHAADDLSVMESLEALPHIVRSTRAIIGQHKGYRIGPSTIGMRHNPYGARVNQNPDNRRLTMTDRDPRQTSLFAAAWMVGYAVATAEAGLQTLTVGNLTGRLGLASAGPSGHLLRHPAFHAARGLAELGGCQRYHCHADRPGAIAVLAGVDQQGRRVLWLANLTGEKQVVVLEGNQHPYSLFLLDELSFTGQDPNPLMHPWRQVNVESAHALQLLPYAVGRLRFIVS